jgi:hypothetical protein
MKIFQTLFWSALLLIPIGLMFAAFESIETAPLVNAAEKLTPAKIARAKALLEEHDPRKLKNNDTKTIRLSEDELSLVASHIIQRIGQGGVKLNLSASVISSQASVQVPGLKAKYFVNVDATLASENDLLRVQELSIGRLKIPSALANTLGKFALLHLYRYSGVADAKDFIKAIKITPGNLAVTYQWQEGLIDAVRNQFFTAKDISRLKRHNGYLVSLFTDAPKTMSLEQVVEYMVKQNSATEDMAREHQAMIISLSNYVNGRRMSSLIPEVKIWPTPKKVKLTIHGRHDLAQHFATSAVLAVAAGRELSNAIGLFKEIDDSDGGSGFSFKDLAADRAGTQFGKLAVSSENNAVRLRTAINNGLGANDLVPSLVGLEEKMTESQFQTRYGGVESKKYKQVVAEIDARIHASHLFQ